MDKSTIQSVKVKILDFISTLTSNLVFKDGEYISLIIGKSAFSFRKDYSDSGFGSFITGMFINDLKGRYAGTDLLECKVNFHNNLGSLYTIISCKFSEFPHCCGKAMGYGMYLGHNSDPYSGKRLSEGSKISILESYFDMCREFLVFSPYTSLTIIISPENSHLTELFPKLQRFKVINKFHNQRMSNKNLCIEYELNLDY